MVEQFFYPGVGDLVSLMLHDEYIGVIDIKDAHQAISIHPLDRPCQVILWDLGNGPEFFFDNRMCMGLSFSHYLFNRISDFVVRCAKRVQLLIKYLDDIGRLVSRVSAESECHYANSDVFGVLSKLFKIICTINLLLLSQNRNR